MRKESKFPVILIGLIAIIIAACYGFLLTMGVTIEGAGAFWVIVIGAISLCVILALGYTVYDRIREMKKQDDDEFDKY